MGPKKGNDSSKVIRKNTNIMIDVKKEIIYLMWLVLCLFFCDRFNGFHWFCVKNLYTKYCKSLNKQSSGVQERINPFYINSYGENSFGLRTFRFTNDLQERIKFVNRGLTVFPSKHSWQSQVTRKTTFCTAVPKSLDPQCGTCCMLHFWRIEFLGGS